MKSLRLGTASWSDGALERRAVVAPLPADPTRLVDLNRVERFRLAKLGEGQPDVLADALVPASLRKLLEGGTRALHRARQTLAYAEKWHQRGDLPMPLALPESFVEMLPCLPRPTVLRRYDGGHLDRLLVQGPGASLMAPPQPTLAVVGIHRGGNAAGWCLALEDDRGAVLGAWLSFEPPTEGSLEIKAAGHHRTSPLDVWGGLKIPALRAGEVVLLPPPRLRAIPGLAAGEVFTLSVPFEALQVRLEGEPSLQTVQ